MRALGQQGLNIEIHGPTVSHRLCERVASTTTGEEWTAEDADDGRPVTVRIDRRGLYDATFGARNAVAQDGLARSQQVRDRPHLPRWEEVLLVEDGPDGLRHVRDVEQADAVVQVLQHVPGRLLSEVVQGWTEAERRYAVGPLLVDLGRAFDDLLSIADPDFRALDPTGDGDGVIETTSALVVPAPPNLQDVRLTDCRDLPRAVLSGLTWERPRAAVRHRPSEEDVRPTLLAPLVRMVVELVGGQVGPHARAATDADLRAQLAPSVMLDDATFVRLTPVLLAALRGDDRDRAPGAASRWISELVTVLRPCLTLGPATYVRPSGADEPVAVNYQTQPARGRRRGRRSVARSTPVRPARLGLLGRGL